MHNLGKVYNDLKLENILIGDQNNSHESLNEIRLIDFGLVSDYLDQDGNHIHEVPLTTTFAGNLAFCSKY